MPERHVQRRPPLGVVDIFTGKQQLDPVAEPALAGKLKQKFKGLAVYSVARIIQHEVAESPGKLLKTTGVFE